MSNMDWKNVDEVDAFIRKGLLLANQPVEEHIDAFDYSPRYQRWEQKLLKNPLRFIKKKSRTTLRRTFDVAAAVLITIAVLFGALMAASPTVRAAVIRWFVEVFSTHTAYHFTQPPDGQTLSQWRPTYLPDGYTEILHIDAAGIVIVKFDNGRGGEILLQYMLINEGGNFSVDNEDVDVIETKIRGYPTYVYRALDDSKMNAVVWINEDARIAFMLTSFEQYEILISIAESMELFG